MADKLEEIRARWEKARWRVGTTYQTEKPQHFVINEANKDAGKLEVVIDTPTKEQAQLLVSAVDDLQFLLFALDAEKKKHEG